MTVGATKKTSVKKSPARKKAAPRKTARKKSARKNIPAHECATDIADSQVDVAETPLAIDEYRQRLGAVGRLMRAALADLEEGQPPGDRLGRGAYLQVMGRAFEVLDGLSQTVEVDDLVKISKVVAEQRRAELNHRKLQLAADLTTERTRKTSRSRSTNGESDDPRDIELPESFGEIVRQIYGTTLADDITGAGGVLSENDERNSQHGVG